MLSQNPEQRHVTDEPPPIFRSWRRLYALVLCYLTALIVLLYAATRYFHY
jgi:hypothetical protein